VAEPEARSIAGIATESIVPGMTVLRMTTVCAAPVLVAQRFADLLAHALDVAQVDAAVGRLGVPTATSDTLRRATASADVGWSAQPARRVHLGHELADALLDDRALARR
jgi:hypothetical protein